MSYITIGGVDDIQVSTFSWTPHYRIALSWDLLAWISKIDRIPCSFTNFITTPELSGPFHINSNIYHTQITEYSLETIFRHHYSQWALFSLYRSLSDCQCYSVRSSPFYLYHCDISPVWTFREHISRALPTEMIFYLLHSTPLNLLLRPYDYSRKLKLGTLEIITNWLQVSIIECNCQWQALWIKIWFVSSSNMVPSDRATCIIASRANFFFKNLSLSLQVEFDVLVLTVSSYIYKLASNLIITPVSKRFHNIS